MQKKNIEVSRTLPIFLQITIFLKALQIQFLFLSITISLIELLVASLLHILNALLISRICTDIYCTSDLRCIIKTKNMYHNHNKAIQKLWTQNEKQYYFGICTEWNVSEKASNYCTFSRINDVFGNNDIQVQITSVRTITISAIRRKFLYYQNWLYRTKQMTHII